MAPSRQDYPLVNIPVETKEEVTPKKGHLMHRSLIQAPHMVDSAKGIYLYLNNGNTVIDACSGAAVALIGHGNKEVVQAMLKQARQVSYVHTQAYTTAPAEDLADILLEGNPHGLEKAFFVGSGSEAVESALKLARQYAFEKGDTERLHFVSRHQSYHGNTMMAMSISTNKARKVPYQGFQYPHVSHVSPAFAYHYQNSDESQMEYTERLLLEIEDEFLRVGPQKIAAFVAETVVGATSGCVAAPAGYFRGVRALCDKYGILLVLDEIMCGVGRTGTFFAFEQEGVVPDIVTIAKGLGGGYATIAGVLIHRRVVDILRRGSGVFNHGHTYQAHPISCAAALAVQGIVQRDGLVERCARMGALLETLLCTELASCVSVGNIRGRGLFWSVEFVKDKKSARSFEPEVGFVAKVHELAFWRGLAVYPGTGAVDGVRGDHVTIAPPFTVTKEQLAQICSILRDSVEEAERQLL